MWLVDHTGIKGWCSDHLKDTCVNKLECWILKMMWQLVINVCMWIQAKNKQVAGFCPKYKQIGILQKTTYGWETIWHICPLLNNSGVFLWKEKPGAEHVLSTVSSKFTQNIYTEIDPILWRSGTWAKMKLQKSLTIFSLKVFILGFLNPH